MRNKLGIAIGISALFFSGVMASKVTNAAEVNSISDKVSFVSTKDETFVHPGISVTPADLSSTRKHLEKNEAPWSNYYAAMTKTEYASETFKSENLVAGSLYTPTEMNFDNKPINEKFSADGFTAYTQALEYYFTGKDVYRANAMRLIRTWSNLSADGFAYYADSHIHVPVPFYYMVSAAELMKYTKPQASSYSYGENLDVNLNWTTEDNQKITTNLIQPMMNTFFSKNDRYFNQHLYSITGRMAGAIFTDDTKTYNETVEWATVNKSTDKPNINGSLKYLYQKIDAKDPRNNTNQSFVQHLEMGRDGTHAGDDVLDFTGLASIISRQNTLVDAKTGTVSKKSNAVSVYQLFDQSLLKGTEQFYEYSDGHTVPWVEFKENGGKNYPAIEANGTTDIIDYGGKIANTGRGRIVKYLNMSELYDTYRYQLKMSKAELTKIAPSISAAAQHLNAPIYYDGDKQTNFWGSYSDTKMTEIGCEYWMSIPEKRNEDQSLAISEKDASSSTVSFGNLGTVLNDKLVKEKEDSKEGKYLSVKATKQTSTIKESLYDTLYTKDTKTTRGGNQIAMPNIAATKEDKQNVAIKVRSNGLANIAVSGGNSGGNHEIPYLEIPVPDTKGKWVTISYDRKADSENNQAVKSDQMDFYAVQADKEVTVDFASFGYVDQADTTTMPTVNENNGKTLFLTKGSNFEYQVAVSDKSQATFELLNAPKGMTISASGVISWKPTKDQQVNVILNVKTGNTSQFKRLNVKVSSTNKKTLAEVEKQYKKGEYTAQSNQLYLSSKKSAEDTVHDASFLANANKLNDAIQNLEQLNPILSADKSFDFNKYDDIVSITPEKTTEKVNQLGMTDNDTETYDGNLTSKYLTLDFGENFAITAKAFGFETRTGFPNRIQGENVYGSNDNKNWTKLTAKETVASNEMQKISVSKEQQEIAYRYLKIQPDNLGPDTDPMYPGITTRGEFHIFGTRIEVNK
jgi:hypothetical protein